MFRNVMISLALLTFFVFGTFAESQYQIAPLLSASFRTVKLALIDFYGLVSARVPSSINTASLFIVMAGFIALLSVKYLAKVRRM